MLSRGGCSLVIIGWCERGQQAGEFLHRLSDLGEVRTVLRTRDSRFSYMTRAKGKLIASEIEFGITLLCVKPQVTAGYPECGLACWGWQMLGLCRARAASACSWIAQRTPVHLAE
uniref:Uncharacterized protein n=1 Tax=Haptolina brevifila TaxID=156173 RepID=A0A7S2JRS4_9EUKA